MIPKKIHYCWFGRNPLPKAAIKCIQSWKKYFPDYEIIEWNEDNYNVNKIRYTEEAYREKKYAFVSDYARFDILYKEGGIYFDTDVEVIKSFDDILENNAFMGCETDSTDNNTGTFVNPGVGMAAPAGLLFYEKILDYYSEQSFIDSDGKINTETVVTRTTKLLAEHGLKNIGGVQEVCGITIYPKEYFNPLNNNTGELCKTENTHSIHWYSMSWLSAGAKIRRKITRPLHKIFGENAFQAIRKK